MLTAPAGSYLGMLLGQLMFMLGNSGGIVSLLTLMGLAAGWEFLKIAASATSSYRSPMRSL